MYYRGCWRGVMGCFFCSNAINCWRLVTAAPSAESTLQPRPSSPAAWLHQACSIVIIFPHCCLRSGPCLSSGCGWSSSDQLRIVAPWWPLPHQQANPIWAHLMARARRSPLWSCDVMRYYAFSGSYPLHQTPRKTLLTRPPLVGEAASCFLYRSTHVEMRACRQRSI